MVWLAATLLPLTATRAQPAFRQAMAIDTFMKALMRGDMKRAYALTGPLFKEGGNTEQHFLGYAKHNRLADITAYYAVEMASGALSSDNDVADVRIVVRWLGQERMFLFNVRREADKVWRIASLTLLGSELSPPIQREDMNARFGVVPAEARLTDMVRTAFVDLAKGLQRKELAKFYESTAELFRSNIPLKEVEQTFLRSQFARNSLAPIDWGKAGGATISFHRKAKFDRDGQLIVVSDHVFGKFRVRFTTKFVIEGLDWKIISFYVRPPKQKKGKKDPIRRG